MATLYKPLQEITAWNGTHPTDNIDALQWNLHRTRTLGP